eukprot:2101326-Ditylum_brightwellii.AAC.1
MCGLEFLVKFATEFVEKDKLLKRCQKQVKLLDILFNEKQNECKDMYCFECHDKLRPFNIKLDEQLHEQIKKTIPWEEEL